MSLTEGANVHLTSAQRIRDVALKRTPQLVNIEFGRVFVC